MASRSNRVGRVQRVFRIADRRYPVLDGAGAALYGGRWNSPGRPAVYAALSYAGALIEKLAQTGRGRIPRAQVWVSVEIPVRSPIEWIDAADLPGWDAADYIASRAFGDRWIDECRSLVLVAPSVVGRPHEQTAVLNPAHRDFARVVSSAPEPVVWDARLFDQDR